MEYSVAVFIFYFSPEANFLFKSTLWKQIHEKFWLRAVSKFVRPEAKFLKKLASGSEIIFPEAKNLASRG